MRSNAASGRGRETRGGRVVQANTHGLFMCNTAQLGVRSFAKTPIFTACMEVQMNDVDVWHSIRFFLMVVIGLTALGVAFFAVA